MPSSPAARPRARAGSSSAARPRARAGSSSAAVGAALAVAVALLLWRYADGGALVAGLATAGSDPLGLALVTAALAGAFTSRATAWSRLLPGLGIGQSVAAVHVSLAANHLLPFRLGEPLRVVSAVRRAGVPVGAATSTTVLLRSADIVALLALGALAAPGVIGSMLGGWGLLVVGIVAAVGSAALVVLVRQRATADVRLPGPVTIALVVAAWLLEAVVVHRWLTWFGIDVSFTDAVLVLAAAVSAQLVAVTPAGIGAYEAAATTALVALGMPVGPSLAAALALHAFTTAYSLITGAVAVVVPRPGFLGDLRLPPGRCRPVVPPAPVRDDPAADPAPVVLVLPARDEAPRIADVIRRAPAAVGSRPVEVLVVDDGSGDGTAAVARAAGATVVRHEVGRGLGAAVRTGLAAATAGGAAAVAFCDADGEYDPAELDRLVAPILAGEAHYVAGSRFAGRIDRMLPHRRAGNRVLTWAVGAVCRVPISDGQSGYRALSSTAAAAATIAHDYNYAQVLTIDLLQQGFGYHEVPISYAYRRTGRSFVRLPTYLRQVVPTVWRQLDPAVRRPARHPEEEPVPCDTTSGPAPASASSR